MIDTPEGDVSDLIDTLANRIGEERLYRFAPVASDVPECSTRWIAPTAPDGEKSWPGHWPRPTRLLPKPELIETVALLPDHPPVTFTCAAFAAGFGARIAPNVFSGNGGSATPNPGRFSSCS